MVIASTEHAGGFFVPGLGPEGVGTMPEPKQAEIRSLLVDYKTYFSGFHGNCRGIDNYYFGRNMVNVPAGHEPVNPPTVKDIIDLATDHVDTRNLSIDVLAPSMRGQARSERIKKFLTGFWATVKPPVLRTAVRHTNAYGIGILKLLWATDQWPNAPHMDNFDGDEEGYKEALKDFLDERAIKFPFLPINVNPKNIVWDDSRARTKWVIEFYQAPVRDIQRRYPEWVPIHDGPFAEWIEYWDEEWMGLMVDGQWLNIGGLDGPGPIRHNYGFMPYFFIQPSSSMDWSDGPLDERYQGMTQSILKLVDEKARLLSAYGSILRQHAWKTINFRGPTTQVRAVIDSYELFGTFNEIPPSVEVMESPAPNPPAELLQLVNLIDTEIEMATVPNVVRGVRPRGVSAGFAISVLAGMGRLRFQGVADGLSRTLELVNAGVLKLVENKAKGRVTVHARTDIHEFDQTISPDDIRGLHENSVSLKAEAPEERERESLLAFRLWNGGNGIISMYEAQKRAGVTNPLDEQLQMGAERLILSPEIQAEQARLVAEGVGLLSQLAETADIPGGGIGNQFLPGQQQLQRPGEAATQRQRVGTNRNQASVFPQGLSGLDSLGSLLGSATGGGTRVPSGQNVR